MLRLPTSIAPLFAAATLSGLAWAAHTSTRTPAHTPASGVARVQAIRFWSFGDVTRVAIQTQGDYKLVSDQIEKPSRVYFDLSGLRPPATARHGIQTIQIGDHRVKQIRVAEISPGKTRIVFDLEGPAEVISSQLVNPDRLMVEIRPKGTSLPALSSPVAHSATAGASRGITTVQTRDGFVVQQAESQQTERQQAERPAAAIETPATLTELSRTVPPLTARAIPITPGPITPSPIAPRTIGAAASPARRDAMGDRSLVRVLGLKMGKVVIDAGHGGHDTGTIGPHGLMEKDLVLDVALRLGKIISQQLGAEVVYTRSDDSFVPLEERTRIANEEKADLFISIHANSSPEPSATGVETYYFNLTSDKSGLDLATRENATSASSISDLNDLLHKAVLQTKLEESREFAQRVQTSLWATSVRMNNRSRDRGVRQAPFVVLIGATMPSVLAEIGFISNPHDEKLMNRVEQRQKIAEGLFKGISQYANSLSHLQIARAGSE